MNVEQIIGNLIDPKVPEELKQRFIRLMKARSYDAFKKHLLTEEERVLFTRAEEIDTPESIDLIRDIIKQKLSSLDQSKRLEFMSGLSAAILVEINELNSISSDNGKK